MAGQQFGKSPVLDNFNRASLGAGWTVGGGSLATVSSTVLGGGGTTAWGYMNGQQYGADCELFATIAGLPLSGASSYMQLWTRFNPADHSCYVAYIEGFDATDLWIFRQDSGFAQTQLADFVTGHTFAIGDKIGISCVGNTISAWYTASGVWTLAGSVTDTTYNRPGYFGVEFVGASAQPEWDDFSGSTLLQPKPRGGMRQAVHRAAVR